MERVLHIQCGHPNCGKTVFEYIESPEYEFGAIRLRTKHHGEKHETIIPLAVALPMLAQPKLAKPLHALPYHATAIPRLAE